MQASQREGSPGPSLSLSQDGDGYYGAAGGGRGVEHTGTHNYGSRFEDVVGPKRWSLSFQTHFGQRRQKTTSATKDIIKNKMQVLFLNAAQVDLCVVIKCKYNISCNMSTILSTSC